MKYQFFVVIEQDECEYKVTKTILREFLGPYEVEETEMVINKEGNREYSYSVPRIGMTEKDMNQIIDLLEPVFAECDMSIIPYYEISDIIDLFKRFSLKELPDKWINMQWQLEFKTFEREYYDVIYYDGEQNPYDGHVTDFCELVRITKGIKEIEYKKQKEIKRNERLKNIKNIPLKQLNKKYGNPRTNLCKFFVTLKFGNVQKTNDDSTKVEHILNELFKIYNVKVVNVCCRKGVRVFYSSSLYIKNKLDYHKMCEIIRPVFEIMDIDIMSYDKALHNATKYAYVSQLSVLFPTSYKFEPERHVNYVSVIIKDLGIKTHVNSKFYTPNDIKKVENPKSSFIYENVNFKPLKNTKFLVKYVGSLEEIILDPSKRKRIISSLEDEKKKLEITKYCFDKTLEVSTEFPNLKIILPRHLRKKDDTRSESTETQEVLKTLLEFGIEFVKEKRFPDCKDKICLPFDIYFTYDDKEIIIECDDESHFKIDFVNRTLDQYEDRRRKDFMKNLYCINTGKYLLRIYDKSSNIRNIVINYLKNIQNAYFVTFSDIMKYNGHNYIDEYIEYLGFTY